MNIKITDPTNQIVQEKSKYPYLAKHLSGTIILFTEKERGVNLTENNNHRLGHYSECWLESDFTPLPPEVKITLSND
jgi:hypothetical protein